MAGEKGDGLTRSDGGLSGEYEANLSGDKSASVHQEVPKEKAAAETVKALKKRYRDRHLAVGRRRQLNKRTQGDGGSRK
jgi:hypothetical protein